MGCFWLLAALVELPLAVVMVADWLKGRKGAR